MGKDEEMVIPVYDEVTLTVTMPDLLGWAHQTPLKTLLTYG